MAAHCFVTGRRQKLADVITAGALSVLLQLQLAFALYGAGSDVTILTPSNFKSTVLNSNQVVLVEFFAPWCGHCKSLAPAWEKAATALKGVVTVAAVDCDQHGTFAQEYGVQGFPTIKVFGADKKKPSDYMGARDAKAIVDHALQQVKAMVTQRLTGKAGSGGGKKGKSASVELTDGNFKDLVLKSKDIWLVEFFAPWCGHCKRLEPEWKTAASNLQNVEGVKLGAVDATVHTSLASMYKIQGYPTILLFGADKQKPIPYEGPRTASGIESYAKEQAATNVPPPELVELINQDVLDTKCVKSAICFVAFLPDILDTGAKGRNAYLETLQGAANDHKRSGYSYVWVEAGKQTELETALGVGGYGYPALVALSAKKQVYAPLKSAFSREAIKTFIRDAAYGGRDIMPVSSIPQVRAIEPWDGKDGELIEEEEFSLSDLEGGDDDGEVAEKEADNEAKEEL
eukprot:TRINITY_DN5310_c0_g1_i3.p1 TRINITY_DN5310_c0_g1~~TRINITY_DN5310_c0_g1_i3.p1  ORF type:complete len:458 (+),score=109.63 TRINITY_DN5310_c0_g1_i3:200-1573(+)